MSWALNETSSRNTGTSSTRSLHKASKKTLRSTKIDQAIKDIKSLFDLQLENSMTKIIEILDVKCSHRNEWRYI